MTNKILLGLFIIVSFKFTSNLVGKPVLVLGDNGRGCTVTDNKTIWSLTDGTEGECNNNRGQTKRLETDKGGSRFTITSFRD